MTHIGVTQWCLDRAGVDAVYRAADFGLSAIQIDAGESGVAPLLNDPAVRQAYKRAAQETGVKITGIAVNLLNIYGMTNPAGSEKSQKCWDAIQIALDAAIDMDVELVFLPSFNDGEIRNEADLLRTAEVLRQACSYVADHAPMVATETTLGVPGHRSLIEAVGHPKLCVLIDSLNPVLWGHRPAELVQEFWNIMSNQFHAKDGINGVMGNALLNTGQANFAETVATLRSLVFSGYVILENEYKSDFETSIGKDIATIKRLFD
jgi:sugar phosphate isomerase/epimerase